MKMSQNAVFKDCAQLSISMITHCTSRAALPSVILHHLNTKLFVSFDILEIQILLVPYLHDNISNFYNIFRIIEFYFISRFNIFSGNSKLLFFIEHA